jgi:hypothetical protein
MRIPCLFLLASLNTVGFAYTHIDKVIEKYELKPLIDSDYWKEHPNELPYEKCALVESEFGEDKDNTKGAVQVNLIGTKTIYQKPMSLFCYSKKLHVGFQVPLAIERDRTVGAIVDAVLFGIKWGHFHNLNKKSLLSVFGQYSGAELCLPTGVCLGGSVLYNHAIILSMIKLDIGLTFEAGLRILHMDKRALLVKEVYAPLYIELWDRVYNKPYRYDGTEDYVNSYEQMAEAFASWSSDEKYSPTWKYWIHHLRTDRLTAQQQQCSQSIRRAYRSCDLAPADLDMFGLLDDEFLESLKFKKL